MKNKNIKKIFAGGLAAVLLLCGCAGNERETASDREYPARDYGALADSTGDGIYLQMLNTSSFLFYMDRKTGKIVWLCGKADCEHGTEGCNAYFKDRLVPDSLQIYENHLYVMEHATREHDSILYRMDLDGSSREKVLEFPSENGSGAARIVGDSLYISGGTMEDDVTVSYIYRQKLDGKEPPEAIFPLEDGGWDARIFPEIVSAGDKLYFFEKRVRETGQDHYEIENAAWEYDTRTEEFRELLKSGNYFTFFAAEGWIYYCEYEIPEDPYATADARFYPVMRKNIDTGETEQTEIPPGLLTTYDGKYCYILQYETQEQVQRLNRIDVCTLDGELKEQIESPVDRNLEVIDMLNIGCTYDAVVAHYCPGDAEGIHRRETIYVYDKSQIGTGKGKWEQISIDEWWDAEKGEGRFTVTQ